MFDLRSNSLSGDIPAELGQLSNLQSLRLYDNGLTGAIPAELGKLSNLQRLNLRSNSLSGAIPAELGQLSNLESLDLHYNSLSGAIPAELGQLSNLKWLELYGNSLSGAIPAELGQLSNLESLSLDSNHLSGCIPEGLRDIENNDLGLLELSFCDATTTQADSNREVINLTFACVRDTSRSCEDMEEFADAVRTRTSGQVEIEISSYDAEGFPLEPTTILAMLRAGAAPTEFVEIFDSGGFIPTPNVISIWEAFAAPGEYATVSDSLVADMIRLVDMSAEGLKVVGANLHSDDHLFSKQPISNLEDLDGLRARIWGDELVGGLLSSWYADIQEMPLNVAYEELASGNLDAAVTCGSCAVNAKLYEVATHIAGPFSGVRPQSYLTFTRWAWEDLPDDIQTIIEEEGRAHTQRELAKAGERDAAGLRELISQGMSYTELPPEILDEWRNALVHIAGVDEEMARVLGLTILPDGSVEKAP